MSEAPLLAVRGLSTFYGSSQALFDVDLTAGARGAVAVLGRNGAGKTTLLRSIIGELRPRQGQIAFEGRDDTRTPTEQRVRRGLGYVPQEHAVFGRLSVRENLAVGAAARRDPGAIDEVLTLFPKLGQRLNQRAGTLSGGAGMRSGCAGSSQDATGRITMTPSISRQSYPGSRRRRRSANRRS